MKPKREPLGYAPRPEEHTMTPRETRRPKLLAAVPASMGVLVFLALARALHIDEIDMLWGMVGRRLGHPTGAARS